jgi:hypothetical protein
VPELLFFLVCLIVGRTPVSPWRNLKWNTVGINEMRVCVSGE